MACRAVAEQTYPVSEHRDTSAWHVSMSMGCSKALVQFSLIHTESTLCPNGQNCGSHRPFFNPSRHSLKYFYKQDLGSKHSAVRYKTNQNTTLECDSVSKAMRHSILLLNISCGFFDSPAGSTHLT